MRRFRRATAMFVSALMFFGSSAAAFFVQEQPLFEYASEILFK